MSRDRIIFGKKAHHVIEIRHIFSNKESRMPGINFLVMDQRLDLLTGPMAVLGIAKVILSAYKHSCGNFSDFSQINFRWSNLSILLLVFGLRTPIELLEFLTLDDLSVMQ